MRLLLAGRPQPFRFLRFGTYGYGILRVREQRLPLHIKRVQLCFHILGDFFVHFLDRICVTSGAFFRFRH